MGAFKEWRESNGANEKKKTTKATLNESGGGFSDWRKKRDEYTKLGFKSEVDYDRFKSFQDIYNNFSERYNSWGENTYKYLKHDVGEKEPSVILSRSNAIPGTIEAIKPNSYRAAIGAENAIARSDTSWNDDEMATDLQMRGKSLRREAGKILESMEQYKDVLSEESYKELSEYFKSISESDLDTIISAIDDELTFRSGYTNKEEYLNLKNRAERHSELDVSLPSKYGIDENTSLLEITALAEEALDKNAAIDRDGLSIAKVPVEEIEWLERYVAGRVSLDDIDNWKKEKGLEHLVSKYSHSAHLNDVTSENDDRIGQLEKEKEQLEKALENYSRITIGAEGNIGDQTRNWVNIYGNPEDVYSRVSELSSQIDDYKLYSYLKKVPENRDFRSTVIRALEDLGTDLYSFGEYLPDYMSGDEFLTYLYLTEKDPSAAEHFHELLLPSLKEREKAQTIEKWKSFAKTMPGFASDVSVVTNLAGGVEQFWENGIGNALGYMGKSFTGKVYEGPTVRNNGFSDITTTIRGTVSDMNKNEIGNWNASGFIYNTLMSGIDSLVAIGTMGPAGGISLGLSAAASATNEALERGLNNRQAFWAGLASGTFEMLFESFSIGQFNALKEVPAETFKDFAKNIAKSMVTNASEEWATEIANILYDTAMHGELSNYALAIDEYMRNHPDADYEEAKNNVNDSTFFWQPLEAAASGALMGPAFTAVADISTSVSGKIKDKAADIEEMTAAGTELLFRHGGAEALANEIMNNLGLDKETYSKLFENAEKLSKAKPKKNGEYSQKTARFAEKVFRDAIGAKGESMNSQRSEIIKKKLESKGVSAEKSAVIAEEIYSSLANEGATDALISKYSEDDVVISAISELTDVENEAFDSSLEDSIREEKKAIMSLAMGRAHFDTDYTAEGGRIDEAKTELGEVVRFEEITDEDGNTVSVPVIEVDGKEVSASDIDLKAGSIYSSIEGMDVGAANEMISAYKKHGEGLKASDFAAEWRLAYQMGLANRSADSADFKGHRFNISPEAAEAARALGQAEYRGERAARETGIKKAQKKKTGREGRISTDKVQNKKLITDGAMTAARMLSIAGYNIEFFEDVSDSADRGSYQWSTNTIRLNVAVGTGRGGIDYILGRTLSHELVHSIQRWNAKGYEELESFIIEKMGDSFEGMVSRKMKRLGLEYAEAVDEVIADGCEMMLRNSKSLTEFAKEHRTLFEKICDIVEEFINKIRGAISSLYGESTALHDEARFMELYADELQAVFDKVLSDALNASEAAVDHNLQSNANKKTAEDGGKVQKSAAEKYTEYDKPITVSDIETLRSIGRKSINDFTSEDIQKAQKWAYKFYKELGVKSPFFRAWFGDWRAYDSIPVAVAKIPEYIATNEARKKNRGTVYNSDTKFNDEYGWAIQISREGETNTISHSGDEGLSEMGLAGIRELIENAILLDSEVHEHHRNNKPNEKIAFDHKFYALGETADDSISLYKITVEEYFQSKTEPGNKKFHNLRYIEKIADNIGGRTSGKNRSGGSTNDISAINYSISDLFALVKQYDKEFKPKPVHGLLVEKGNPRKFYHGTNSEFFEFDLKKSGANYGDTSEGLLFFTSKKSAYPDSATDYAREITKKNGGKETVREVYISMQKPLVLDSRGYYTTQAYFDQNSDEIYIKFLSADYDGIIIHNSDKSADDAVLAIVDNAGQVKSATYSEDLSGPTDNIGAFDRGQKDIRYSRGESYGAVRENAATAKKDSEGRKLSHQQMEYFSLSVIRDKRGRLLPVYHGTKSAGFNVFSKSDDIGYFFARSLRTAETYSGTKDIYTPDRSSPDFSGAANYKVYLNITNPLIIEGKGAYWNNLEATDDLVDLDIAIKSIGEDGSCNVKVTTGIKGKTKKHTFKNTKDLYSFFESTFNTELANGMTKYIDMSVADTGKMDVSVQFPWNFEQRRESYDVKKTRDIVRRAYESPNRYDGVIFRNIVDAGTRTKITPDDVYVALKPEQIKSVNNTNPTSAMDIRYSRGEGYEANKKTAENGGKVQYSKEKRTFSYDELVKKDDLEVVVIGKKQQPKTTNGLIDDDYIVKEVKKQCKTLTTNGKPVYYVNVPDIGRNVEIVNDGITHGFSRPKDRKQGKSKPKAIINARVSLELPNILKNSIEINRSSRGSNIDVPFTHVMIGTVALEGTNGEIEFYAVRSMIQERKNQNPLLTEVNILGKLTSLKAKKIGSPTGQVDGNIVALTDGSAYRYSIADLLADVKSVFDDTFSNDVYAHFNMNRRNTKGFSEHLQYSRGEGYDPYAEYHYYENRKVYGESLVDALERTVETQEDQAIIDDYRKVEKEVDEMRTELAALNNEIFETIYTPMDQAEAYRIEGMRNDVKTLNREIRALEKEVKKARDNVTVTEGVIRDPQSSENARNSALIGVVQERQALTRLERTLAAKKSALEDITAQIDEARDPRRMKLEELREKAAKLRREISKADKSLLDLRSTKRFRTLLARERALAIKETKELMGRRQKESAKRQENTVLRQRIWNELQRLDKMLALPSVAKHIPDTMRSTVALLSKAVPGRDVDYDAKIAALEEKLENSTGQEYREARERMAEYLAKKEYAQRVTSALSDFFTSFDEDSPVFDEAVYKEIEALKKEIAGKSLDELDNSELKRLNDVICATKAAIKNADKVFGERRGLAELGMEGTEEVLSASDDTARGPARQKLHDFLEKQKYSMLKPYELFEITGSTVLYERFRKLQAREGVYYRNVNEASEYYKRVAKEHGITDRMLREKFSFTTSEGREIALSINEIMSIYLMKDRAQAMVHLTNPSGGFRFAGGYTVETKKAKAAKTADEKIQAVKYVYKKTSEPVHLTDVDVISIGNMLTKEQKAFANAIQRYMADVLGEKGNEVSMALHDFKKYNDPDYFPIHTDESYRFLSIEKAAGEIQLKNLGFTKDLKYKASGPLVLENMTDVFARHANEMSLYNAFAVELENMKRVLNYSPEGDPGGGMKAALGQALTDEIVDFIKSVNGGLRSESMGVADTMISLNKAARVGASLSVAIQQPSAILRSFAMIDPKYFAGIPGKGSWEEMKKYTATAGIKELGGVDVNTSRAITDQLTELEAKGRTAGANVSKAIAKAAFILPEVGDRMAWISLWNACKREAAQSYHGEAILIEAGKRFDEIVNRTQVYDSVFSRSKLMRSKNTFAKMVTAFMAEPMTTANMVLQAARDFKTGNKAKGIRAIAAVATSILINNALVAIIYAMRDDDEDESYIEKYIEAFLQKMGTDVNPVTYIPVFKDVLSLIQGYDVERMDMSLVSDVLDEAQALVNLWMKEDATTEEWMNAWLSFGGRILDFAGVPISNFSRDANAVFVKLPETWKTKSTKQGLREALRDGLFEDTLFEKFWKPSDTDANKLYRAIVSGDTARYKQITKRLDEEGKTTKQMQSLIVTGLKDNDERVSAAAEAKSSGDLAKYEKLLKEISKDGFASSYVAKAVDSVVAKMNAEPPEEDELGVPDPRENEKYSSIYNADDIFINLEEGDTKEAQIAIDDIYINKYNKALDELEDDEDEEDAVRKAYNSMRSMISSEYSELYKSGDDAERERIEELLLSIYVNGEQLYKEKTIEGWGEDD